MQLGELFKLLHKAEPLAARHRDHICSEAAVHDFAHCPKPMARVFAWRVPADASAKAARRRAPFCN
jgi:hypothetical protein